MTAGPGSTVNNKGVRLAVTPAGTIGADAVFSVDKTPINVNPSYPSIFHYGAVVSPMDDGVDWNDKAAWGIKDRSTAGGLG